jgi:hypothetical protein
MTTPPTTALSYDAENAFIDDESARDCESCERPQHEFLMTGRNPKVGQRMRSYLGLTSPNGWCRFSGIVTHVGEEPTFEQWCSTSFWPQQDDSSGSSSADGSSHVHIHGGGCEECGAGEPACWSCKLLDGKESLTCSFLHLQDRCKNMMGALHNQTITAYAYLVFYGDPTFTLPFSVGRIYKMSFQLNDVRSFLGV